MPEIHIQPNKPVTVALVDPEGVFDFEIGVGVYLTTAGETLQLPRPAVVLLNALSPAPGQSIVITKHWSGKREPSTWTVEFSTACTHGAIPTEQCPHCTKAAAQARPLAAAPVPIDSPARRQPAPGKAQPSLFDRGTGRGTGTFGPAPQVYTSPAIARHFNGQIPANVATKEILEFLAADPNTQNWSAKDRQELACTILTAAYRAGHIGLWEREP